MSLEKYAKSIDALKRQCDKCKIGKKKIGPKSGCDLRKKLIIEQSEIAWEHKKLFLNDKDKCTMFQPKEN